MLTRREIKAIAEEICRILKKTYEDPPDQFLNVSEAASFLSVSKSYIYHNLGRTAASGSHVINSHIL